MLLIFGGIAVVAIMAAISDAVSCCPSSAITDAYREVSEQIQTHGDLCNCSYFSLCLLYTLGIPLPKLGEPLFLTYEKSPKLLLA